MAATLRVCIRSWKTAPKDGHEPTPKWWAKRLIRGMYLYVQVCTPNRSKPSHAERQISWGRFLMMLIWGILACLRKVKRYVCTYIKPRIHSPRLLTNRAPYALRLKLYVQRLNYLSPPAKWFVAEKFRTLCSLFQLGRADSPRWGGPHEVLSLCQH